jgi:GxxExxY protein
MMSLVYEEETYKIIGACIEVHKNLGNGFLEAVYQEALEKEMELQNIPYEREKFIRINYKNIQLKKYYKTDFICFNKVVLELKALSCLSNDNDAQLLNYLKASGYKVGLLINFGKRSLEHKRFIL